MTSSTVDSTLTSPIYPFFTLTTTTAESPNVHKLIKKLNLQKHPEGGYFYEYDRDPLRIPNPFRAGNHDHDCTRSASTTIFYLLTPASSLGHFHKNKSRTIHTLHSGRARYVIIHADEKKEEEKARVETFVVGHDIHGGEKLQWVVEGGKFKASFLLPDTEGGLESEGCLISETVVPGFEFTDHDFMTSKMLYDMLTEQQASELQWLVSQKD